MAEKEFIRIAAGTKAKITPLAAESGLSVDVLVEVLLEAFIQGKGKVYVGAWKEGPGIRLLPDWPRFSSGVTKILKENMR